MTTYGIDFAWNGPTAAQIHADGDVVSCRYLSPDPSKNATKAEVAADLKAGVDVVLVWEAGAGNAGKGAAQGKTDGERAAAQAKALGVPKGMTLYAAVDYDAAPATVLPYFQAFTAAVHAAGFLSGAYGSYRVCQYLLARKVVVDAWQTAAWSAGKVLAEAALYQNARTKRIGGKTVDVDVVLHPSYGGWKAAVAANAPKPKPAAKPAAKPAPKPAPRKRVVVHNPFKQPDWAHHPVDMRHVGLHGGDAVRFVQWALGRPTTGTVASADTAALKTFQRSHRCGTADAVAGRKTGPKLAAVTRTR